MYSELNKQKIMTPKLIHAYNPVSPVLFLSKEQSGFKRTDF